MLNFVEVGNDYHKTKCTQYVEIFKYNRTHRSKNVTNCQSF